MRGFRVAAVLLSLIVVALAGCSGPPSSPSANTTTPTPPPMPSPTPPAIATAATATISAASGGVLNASDGRLLLSFPPGAVANDTVVTARPRALSETSEEVRASGALGTAWRLEPDGLTFAKPVAVTYRLALADLAAARLPLSDSVPTYALASRAANGSLLPLEDATVRFDLQGATLVATANTTHFSDLELVSLALRHEFHPTRVAAFVGDPPFEFTWTVKNIPPDETKPRTLTLSDILVRPETREGGDTGGLLDAKQPVYNHPANIVEQTGPSLLDDLTLASRETKNVSSRPMMFKCIGPGHVVIEAWLTVRETRGGNVSEGRGSVVPTDVTCVPRFTLNATFAAPVTTYTIAPDLKPFNVTWNATISCGTWESSEHVGRWSHPNAPKPEDNAKDANNDRIPDYCPHSETSNPSHNGTIKAVIRSWDVWWQAGAACSYAGSLAGSAKCVLDPYECKPTASQTAHFFNADGDAGYSCADTVYFPSPP